jgi:hypothetical protein
MTGAYDEADHRVASALTALVVDGQSQTDKDPSGNPAVWFD